MKRCIFVVLCLLLVSLGIANNVGATAGDLILDITSPENGAKVSSPVIIEGTISGSIPQDHDIWIIHNPVNSGLWYPDGIPNVSSNTWNQLVYLVDPPGKNYNIKAVLVDNETSEKYQKYLDDAIYRGFPEKTETENTTLLDSILLIKGDV
ncbi:MAG: hypothetical protein JW999_11570 [Methanotrichaceae archaeon]|nr:hypothetical protein [Methanotrichaceae archaeon]